MRCDWAVAAAHCPAEAALLFTVPTGKGGQGLTVKEAGQYQCPHYYYFAQRNRHKKRLAA